MKMRTQATDGPTELPDAGQKVAGAAKGKGAVAGRVAFGKAERRKGVAAVGKVVPGLVPAGGREGMLAARLMGLWPSICPALAAWSYPMELSRDGVLRVAVASDPVKQELSYLSPQIVAGANVLLGYEGVVKVIGITRSWKRPARVNGVKAASQEQVDKMKARCKNVADDDLREALARLGAVAVGTNSKKE